MKASILGVAAMLLWLGMRWQDIDLLTWFIGLATGVGIAGITAQVMARQQ